MPYLYNDKDTHRTHTDWQKYTHTHTPKHVNVSNQGICCYKDMVQFVNITNVQVLQIQPNITWIITICILLLQDRSYSFKKWSIESVIVMKNESHGTYDRWNGRRIQSFIDQGVIHGIDIVGDTVHTAHCLPRRMLETACTVATPSNDRKCK